MKKRNLSFRIALIGGLLALLTVLAARDAQACRDCPFPMRIGENQWLMPNSSVVLSIEEYKFNSSKLQTRVVLHDSRTGEVLAVGTGTRTNYQRSLNLVLWDRHDRRLSGVIYWVDFNRPVIKAKFSCLDEACSIDRRL